MPFLLKRCACLLPLFWLGCGHAEPSHRPLGLGPLAIAEQKTRTNPFARDLSKRQGDAPTNATAVQDEPKPQAEPSASPAALVKALPTNGPATPVDAGVLGAQPTLEDWLGLYQGNDITRYVMADQPDRSYDDPKAKIRVEHNKDATLAFVFVDSSNGQDLCTMQGDVAGNEAKLLPGQRCFIDPDEGMSVSSRPGLAKRAGNRLSLNVILDTTIELDDGKAEGRIEYEFEGTKQ